MYVEYIQQVDDDAYLENDGHMKVLSFTDHYPRWVVTSDNCNAWSGYADRYTVVLGNLVYSIAVPENEVTGDIFFYSYSSADMKSDQRELVPPPRTSNYYNLCAMPRRNVIYSLFASHYGTSVLYSYDCGTLIRNTRTYFKSMKLIFRIEET